MTMIDGFDTSLLPQNGGVLCAISGGADSVYLLCRLCELRESLGLRVWAAHYNHCLRGAESDRDEDFVRALCAGLGVEAYFGRGDVAAFARENGLGTEGAARRLRYEFLEQTADALGADAIATAHTADDNAETMLLNLARGAGLRGLCGIPPRRGRVIRPILGVTREEIDAYLEGQGVAHVEDSSNAGDDYARNRIRHHAVPALRSVNPEFPEALPARRSCCGVTRSSLRASRENSLKLILTAFPAVSSRSCRCRCPHGPYAWRRAHSSRKRMYPRCCHSRMARASASWTCRECGSGANREDSASAPRSRYGCPCGSSS